MLDVWSIPESTVCREEGCRTDARRGREEFGGGCRKVGIGLNREGSGRPGGVGEEHDTSFISERRRGTPKSSPRTTALRSRRREGIGPSARSFMQPKSSGHLPPAPRPVPAWGGGPSGAEDTVPAVMR